MSIVLDQSIETVQREYPFPRTSFSSDGLRMAVMVMAVVEFKLYSLLCSAYPNDLQSCTQTVIGSNLLPAIAIEVWYLLSLLVFFIQELVAFSSFLFLFPHILVF